MKILGFASATRWVGLVGLLVAAGVSGALAAGKAPVTKGSGFSVLFLGDKGHHQPAERFKQIEAALSPRGFQFTYTEKLDDLNAATLARYDVLAIYANHTRLAPEQEKALLDFVAGGKGLAPIHCASACFGNSPAYVALVGGKFKSHGTGVFKETIVNAQHPIMQGLAAIESWDESYVHSAHNAEARTVLAERRDEKGAEPYTWVRTHGQGRVFYTAWGHDQRTWAHAGFHVLIENGLRWAAGDSAEELHAKTGLKPFEYEEANVPFYAPGGTRKGDAKWNQMQKPLAPEESAKHIVTLPGFAAQLWAADPQIKKPISMAWDERGRLWIAETVDYPNEMQPPGAGRDRIVICEDTDGDGRADKFTVFADKLSIPTGFAFANGGVVVVQAPDTLFLKDTDGDGKADERRVLFTGWGTGDTHAGPSNIRWGFDNWIWGVVGYSGFNGEVGGEPHRFSMGFFRFKPDGSKLEFVRSSNNNTWGFGWSEDAIVFGSTANGNPSMYMPIPNRYYEAVNGWSASRVDSIATSSRFFPVTEKVRQVDVHGGYTAAAGHALYTARSFPKVYWNRVAFVTEPTGHLVGKFVLQPSGADFVSQNSRTFLASDDEWTAPIMAEVGPDGALWVIDWYNYIVQHNPTPAGFKSGKGNAYEIPLRDKTHGRIYRVTHQDGKLTKPLDLSKASADELVATLKHENLLWRMHAQRLLVERKLVSAADALVKLVRDKSVDELGLNPGALHAIWTLHGLGELESGYKLGHVAAREALKHPAAGVRRAAVMALRKDIPATLVTPLLDDADAQVRLAAFLALADFPADSNTGEAVFAALKQEKNGKDKWLQHAAIAAAARHDAGFLKAALASVPHAEAPKARPAVNIIANPSFENETAGKPLDWNTRTYSGRATHSLSDIARTGARSIRIESTEGSDTSYFTRVALEPNTTYRLSAWIKTENLKGARGAQLNLHEAQGIDGSKTPAISGTKDWTRVESIFNSGGHTELTINCLFGGWGRSTGVAWFDDIELVAISGGGAVAGVPAEVGQALRIVTGHYAARVPIESVVPTLLALNNASPALALPILDGLATGWPAGTAPKILTDDAPKLVALLKSLPNESRGRLVSLADRWNRRDLFASEVETLTKGLKTLVADARAAVEERVDAARQLVLLDDQGASSQLVLDQVSLTAPPALTAGMISAVSESHQPQTGPALIAAWPKLTPASRRATISALLRRAEWINSLLDAIEKGTLKRGDIAAEYWQQLKGNSNRDTAARARKLEGAKPAPSSAEMAALTTKLLPIANQKGDAKRGKEIFEQVCINCHTLEGKGGKIGPELTGIGIRPRADILVDIIDPNRSVEANFRQWSVTTKSGETVTGRLEAETQTSVEILDLTGVKHVVQRKDIAKLNASLLSIMPTGFEQLPPADLAAILEYLALSSHEPKK
jgi:putative membrane-bound dehydrogenase-like protein